MVAFEPVPPTKSEIWRAKVVEWIELLQEIDLHERRNNGPPKGEEWPILQAALDALRRGPLTRDLGSVILATLRAHARPLTAKKVFQEALLLKLLPPDTDLRAVQARCSQGVAEGKWYAVQGPGEKMYAAHEQEEARQEARSRTDHPAR